MRTKPGPKTLTGMLPPAGWLLTTLLASGVSAQTFEDQLAEYIREYPRQRTWQFATQFTGGDAARLNTWLIPGKPSLVRPGDDVFPRANNDTFYQVAIVWLEEPVVLASTAASRNRFSSFQLQDERNANYRNIVFPEGEYTLYYGNLPNEIRGEAIRSPSRLSVVFARVEVRDPDDAADVGAARAVLEGMTISGARPDEFPVSEISAEYSDAIIDAANRRMDEVFASVPFTETIVGPGQQPGTDVAYLHHAAGTKNGFGGPDPAHSAYEAILFDENGAAMFGRNGTYCVTTEEPEVDAFWSVTVYDTERGGFLHPNRHNKYHVNDTLAVRNADGTVTFRFRQSCAVGAANCLEVPEGRFEIVTRYYLPGEQIVSGEWTFPGIEFTSEAQE